MTVTEATLSDLIIEARDKKLWLRCAYQDLWFSPDELEAANAKGEFRWGAINFELVSPYVKLASLRREVEDAKKRVAEFEARKWGAA